MDDFENKSKLTPDEIAFLEDATNNATLTKEERYEEQDKQDDDEIILDEPSFPKGIVIVFTVISVLLFMIVASAVNSLSKYDQLFQSDVLQQAVGTEAGKELGLDNAYKASQVYQFRWVIYLLIILIAFIIIGAIVLIWFIRHHRWEQMIMSDDWELVDDDEDDDSNNGNITDDPDFQQYLMKKYTGLQQPKD